jgi:acyl CoA:acetate/3-ketoacid CoA transferase
MEFKPVIKEAPKLMDACIFLPEPLGLSGRFS